MLDKYSLKLRQAMPLKDKIRFTERRIHEWVEHFGVNGCYVSFSGGKDSTVLLYIVRSLYPDIEAVFVDTGLEYPEIRQFVKSFHTVTILRPEMRFDKVLEKYGYPIVSKEVSQAINEGRIALQNKNKYQYRLKQLNGEFKNGENKSIFNYSEWKFLLDAPFKISNRCCNVMKKKPAHQYHKQTGKVPFIATMADESRRRESQYKKSKVMVRIGGKGMKYIVQNCPAITNNLTCRQAIYENMFCDYRTDCIIKQVIEKCKENLSSLETYVDIRSYECTILQNILDLFDIEEINK